MSEPRTYIFYLYRWSRSKQQPYVFDSTTCAQIGTPYRSTETNFEHLLAAINSRLRICLHREQISHFVPLKKPSLEISRTGDISVIYYHNDDLHDIIFNSRPGMVLMPIGELRGILDSMLLGHGLEGWEDPRGAVLSRPIVYR